MYCNMKTLFELYSIHSMSGQEKRLKRYVRHWVRCNVNDAVCKTDYFGNLYVQRGRAESYPCVVAHLDQVQRNHSRDFQPIYDAKNDIIYGFSKKCRAFQGLGADDKNGIWVALQALQCFQVCKVALFCSEETGCQGSSHAKLDFFSDCRFVLQVDRKNGGDLITTIYDCMASEAFLKATNFEQFGYKEAEGFMTDVAMLRERGVKCCCVNISCGYYQPHTDHEFTIWSELLNCRDFVFHIIEHCTETYLFEPPVCLEPDAIDDYQGAMYDGLYDTLYDIMTSCPDFTFEDLRSYFQLNHPTISGDTLRTYYDLVNADIAYWKKNA